MKSRGVRNKAGDATKARRDTAISDIIHSIKFVPFPLPTSSTVLLV